MKRNILSENWSGSLEVGSLGCISNPETIDRINRELDKLNYGQCINPYSAINKIRNLLAVAGLSFDNILNFPFDDSGNTMFRVGKLVMPLKQWGGPVGMKADGEYHMDDGVSEKVPGGLALHLHYTNAKGTWSVEAHVMALNKDVEDATLKEKNVSEAYKDHAEAHADLIKRGYERLPGGIYKDNKSGGKVRIHSSTLHVYRVNEEGDANITEELDPVRDAVSRRGLVGKVKGLARDVVSKYKSNQAAGQAAAKKVRQDMGVEPTSQGKERLLYNKTPRDKSSKYFKVGNHRKFSDVVHSPAPKLPEEKKLLLGQKPNKVVDKKGFDKIQKDAADRVTKAQKKYGIKPEPPIWLTGR